MATLGTYTFDDEHTSITDSVDEVAGRTRRVFAVSGLIVGKTTATEIVAELDAIADAVSAGGWTMLSVRPDRFINVERLDMSRRVDNRELIGSFKLRLGAADPFERSAEVSEPVWQITGSGATKTVSAGGTIWSELEVEMVASGDVINPSVGDGTRNMQYLGTVPDGGTLLVDGYDCTVTLDGKDVMPYTLGEFPRVDPAGTTLTYTDAESSSHTAAVVLSWSNRWR